MGDDSTSPLAAIESAVKARAKDMELDVSAPEGESALMELIDEEVRRWSERARRSGEVELARPERVARRAFLNLHRYGPLSGPLADDDVWEIMLNAPDQIFLRKHRGTSGYHDEVFHDDDHVVRTLTRILDDATASHRKLDPAEGLQDAQLDGGARLHIVHGDLTRGGHVVANIRKFAAAPFRSLDDLVERGSLTAAAADLLASAVRARLSIVFAGAPGSGKTTLLSCCAAELDPALRVVTAEEVFELDVPAPNLAAMQTRPARPDRPEVDLRRLVAGFLRMAPDVAVVGEVREREALALLLTLSSGVKGYTTIHAGSAQRALTRLRFLCQLAPTSSPLPLSALNTLVSESVDLVVHCERSDTRPRVREVIAVEDLAAGADATVFTTTQLFATDESGALVPTGLEAPRCSQALRRAGWTGRR